MLSLERLNFLLHAYKQSKRIGLHSTRGERLPPQMGVIFKRSQSMRAIVCYSLTWLQIVAHAKTGARQLSFIEAHVGLCA
jgi:hypothetical protein